MPWWPIDAKTQLGGAQRLDGMLDAPRPEEYSSRLEWHLDIAREATTAQWDLLFSWQSLREGMWAFFVINVMWGFFGGLLCAFMFIASLLLLNSFIGALIATVLSAVVVLFNNVCVGIGTALIWVLANALLATVGDWGQQYAFRVMQDARYSELLKLAQFIDKVSDLVEAHNRLLMRRKLGQQVPDDILDRSEAALRPLIDEARAKLRVAAHEVGREPLGTVFKPLVPVLDAHGSVHLLEDMRVEDDRLEELVERAVAALEVERF